MACTLVFALAQQTIGSEVHVTSLNFRKNLFFLPELQNRAKHLPQLLKPFILPLWPCYSSFEGGFVFFFFIYFG
jgi:hypothetical protein